MKKRYLLMLAVGLLQSKLGAQTIYQNILPKFKHIQPVGEKCIESVLPFVDPTKAGGDIFADTLDYGSGQELLRQVMWLKTNSEEDFESLDSVRKGIENEYISRNILPITVLDYTYKIMRDSVRDYGLEVDKDTFVRFKMGVSDANVFETKYLFQFTTPIEHVRNDFTQFVIDERLMLSNVKLNPLGKWFFKFGQATMQVQPNVPFQVALGSDSLVIAELSYEVPQEDTRLSYMENPWYNTSSTAKVSATKVVRVNVSKDILDVFEGQGLYLKTVNAFPGLPDLRANISVHYGKNKYGGLNPCIQKPVIFVEGIDFGYKGYPIGERDAKCGSMGYLDLLKGKQWNVEKQRWEVNLGLAQAPAILEKYRREGFDVIYVDFFDGAADMDFNSEVLIKVIQEVQSTMCGEKIHVVGVSMGGIVSKMALKKMENRHLPNCVVSYTSFDAPQQGANIPLGVQRFVSHMSSLSGDCKDIRDRMLRRPAARQLLVLHETSTKGHDNARQLFMRWDSLQGGYPKNMWLLGVSNGSGLGDKGVIQKISGGALKPGDDLLSIRFKVPVFDLFKSLAPTRMASIFAAHRKQGGSTFVVGKVNGLFTDKWLYSSLTNLELDHVSGSWNGAVGAFSDFGKLGNIFIKTTFNTHKTTFVSSVSSLDIRSKSSAILSSKGLYDLQFTVNGGTFKDILGPKLTTPFQRVYVPKENQEHVFLDSTKFGNAIWLLGELIRIDTAEHQRVIQRDYNFRTPMAKQVKSFEVLNGAKFELNGSGSYPLIAKADSVMNRTFNQRKFTSSMCGDSRYLITDTSEFCIGSKNSSTEFEMNNRSRIELKTGSKLFLPTGSNKLILKEGSEMIVGENCVLEIGNGSQCIVESGSKLHFKRGGKLILNGEISMLHIKGQLILDSGVVLEPIGKLGSRVGMLKFSNVGYGYGDAKVVALGKGVVFNFTGNGRSGFPNLQIEGKVLFPYKRSKESYALKGIHMSDSRVYFGANAAMIAGDSLMIEASHFESADWAQEKGKGIVYEGERLRVSKCSFSKMDSALRVISVSNNGYNEVSAMIVTGCKVGMHQIGGSCKVSGSKFEENSKGLIFENLGEELYVEDCNFMDQGVSALEVKNGSLNSHFAFVLRNEFLRNKVGILISKQHLLLRCNYFTLNQVGAYVAHSKLNMNQSIYKWSNMLDAMFNGGNNSFTNNYTASIQLFDAMPFIEGKNNFNRTSTFSGSKIQIEGTVNMDINQPYWDAGLTKVLVGLNYWSAAKNNFNSDSIDVHFVDLKNAQTGASLKLHGGTAAKFSADLCYNAGKSYDLDGEFQGGKGQDLELDGPKDADMIHATSEGFSVKGGNVQIYVYNTNGQVVFTGMTKGEGQHFYHLATGIYFVKVAGSAGSSSKKILVTN